MVMRKILGIIFLIFVLTNAATAQTFQEGVAQFENGDYESALQTFQKLKSTDRSNPEVYFYAGRSQFEQDELKKAVKEFEKAAELNSGNSYYYMWLGHSFGRQAQNASMLQQAGLARNSRKNYEKAIELDPNNIEARESAIEYYLQAPRFLGGGRSKAELQATALEKIETEAGIIAWGRIYTYYDEVEIAEYHYKTAIEQHPEIMGSYYQLFNFYFNQAKYSTAADIALQQLQVNDTTAVIYHNLGNAQQRYNLFDQALENYMKALELDENFSSSFYQIGRLAAVSFDHLETGKLYINKFIALENEVSDSFMAWAYFRLGTIEEHQNEKENAMRAYQSALEFDSDHEEAKLALNALK